MDLDFLVNIGDFELDLPIFEKLANLKYLFYTPFILKATLLRAISTSITRT
jgi:hypothetical protein